MDSDRPFSPYDVPPAEQGPAKLWELLRRNLRFQADARSFSGKNRKTKASRSVAPWKPPLPFAEVALDWMSPRTGFEFLYVELEPQYLERLKAMASRIAEGVSLIDCEQSWPQLPLRFREEFIGSVKKVFPILEDHASDFFAVRGLNGEFATHVFSLEQASECLRSNSRNKRLGAAEKIESVRHALSHLQSRFKCFAVPDRVLDKRSLQRFLSEIRTRLSSVATNNELLGSNLEWECFLHPKTNGLLYRRKAVNKGTVSKGKRRIRELIKQVYPVWTVKGLPAPESRLPIV